MVGGDNYLGRSSLSLCRTIASIKILSRVRKEKRIKERKRRKRGRKK
jgi:hypothetical protein